MKKTKHGSEERGVTFQMIITYRKRLLMELQIKKLIYFILMRDSSEEPCVPLTKTNKLRGLRGGGYFGPCGRPLGRIWCLTQKISSWSQRNNASRTEATERTVTHNVMAEVKVRSYCWQEKSEKPETLFMSAVEIFQLFLNENLLLTLTPASVNQESGPPSSQTLAKNSLLGSI